MKKFFKKVFGKFKKILSPIGKELKKGLGEVGKFFGKLGPIGTLALSLILPGIGTALSSFGAWAGVGAGAAAPFSGTIFGPLGKVIQGVARVGSKIKNVYSSVSDFVGATVNKLTGGTFETKFITNEAGELVANQAYKPGLSGKFSDWVSTKLNDTRKYFGLETSMNEAGMNAAIENNSQVINSVPTTAEYDQAKIISDKSQAISEAVEKGFTAQPQQELTGKSLLEARQTPLEITPEGLNKTALTDIGGLDKLTLQERADLGLKTYNPDTGNFVESFDKTIVKVPVGYTKVTPENLKGFETDTFKLQTYVPEYKEVYKGSLTTDQFDALNIDDVNYFQNFENKRIAGIETNVMDMQKSDPDNFAKLTTRDIQRQALGKDVAAIAKPAAFVGSMLAPTEPEKASGYVNVDPMPTDTDVRDYENSVAAAYSSLGYKGSNTIDGYAMFGGYGNTPYNFFNNYAGLQSVPAQTTPMPVV